MKSRPLDAADLQALEVGAEVAISSRYGKFVITTITNKTTTGQITTADGRRFTPKGQEITSGSRKASLYCVEYGKHLNQQLDEEEALTRLRIQTRQALEKVIANLCHCDKQQLQAIAIQAAALLPTDSPAPSP